MKLISVLASIIAAALLLLTGCTPAPSGVALAAEPQPAVTVTVTATATAPTQIPQTCLQALDEADELVLIFRDTMQIVSDTFRAASVYDIDGMNVGAAKISAQTDKIAASAYGIYSRACRSEAGS